MYKVVIIDDEPWTRGVVINLAQWDRLHMEVVGEAADGETGLALIHKVNPDVIITDVRMPRLGGIDLVRALRSEGVSTPVLIISGYDDFSYVRDALKLGVTDYILKPIKAQELNQQLQRCLEQLCKMPEATHRTPMRAGFFADGWEKGYYRIREKIETALQLGNQELLRKHFQELGEVIETNEGSQPGHTVLIGVYYALLAPLQKYIETMNLLRDEVFIGKRTSFVFSVENTTAEMLTFVCDLYLTTIQQIEKQKRMRTHLDIEAVCRYLEEHYIQGVTLGQTADAFHVTKEYLSKAFKAAKKEGFTEYVTALRMKQAYELITVYDAPLKEVGAMVGYFDLAHFYKSFKKYYGKTPGEVRDRLKKDNETTP